MIRLLLATIIGYSRRFRASSLFMNSVYLMMATLVLAGFGFIFWAIVAQGYSTASVGIATTLLSLSGLLSMLSLVGFDTTFVRFLPSAKRKSRQISSGLIITAVVSTVASLLCVLSLSFTSPQLAFVSHDPFYVVGFVFFTVVTSLNILTNAIFLAFKRARTIFAINAIFSVVKVALPLYITDGSPMTIFVLAGISQLVGLVVSLLMLKHQIGYHFSWQVDWSALRATKKYSLAVYVSSVLNLLPPTLLPLAIVHQLNSESAAYYYMAFTIASVLYTIAYASTQSAFAEGSHNESALRLHVVKAARLIGALLVPAAVVIALLSGFILSIFGEDYTRNGRSLLLLFVAAAPFVAAYSGLGAIFKVMKRLRAVVVMNSVYTAVILIGSYAMMPRIGIIAIGWGWAAGNVAATGVGLFYLRYGKH